MNQNHLLCNRKNFMNAKIELKKCAASSRIKPRYQNVSAYLYQLLFRSQELKSRQTSTHYSNICPIVLFHLISNLIYLCFHVGMIPNSLNTCYYSFRKIYKQPTICHVVKSKFNKKFSKTVKKIIIIFL